MYTYGPGRSSLRLGRDLVLCGSHLSALRPVKLCKCFHLLGRQLPRDRAHLLIDVVVADALSERSQLSFDVCGVLAGQRRSPKPEAARSMTGRAGRDAAPRITREYQACSRVALLECAPTLRYPLG